MKITRYSKDVDILMVKVSDEPIGYAEEADRFIVHFSKDGKPVLLEILEAKDFIIDSFNVLFKAIQSEGMVAANGANEAEAPSTDEASLKRENANMLMDSELIYQDKAAKGKYHKLYSHLCNLAEQELPTSFGKIEAIVGFELPRSAYIHRAWWANERSLSSHTHALAWTAAGWETAKVDMKTKSLLFWRKRQQKSNKDRLFEILPVHSAGAWPKGLSLRRESIYDERV